jgi:hypothetical protein
MPPAGFELNILTCERPQAHTLDRVTPGTGCLRYIIVTSSLVFGVVLNKYVNNDHLI